MQIASQQLAVERVEAVIVDAEHRQRRIRRVGRNDAAGADLGVVADALEQPVGDARRTAAAPGDRLRAFEVERDLEDRSRPRDDLGEVVGVVGLEPVLDPEAVAQRRRQQARARRRADQRERRQVERDDPRARRPGRQ